MARILCTGNVTLDIINTVDHYPVEDEEMRALAHDRRSGGNAANTALVLNQLRQDVYFSGVIANDSNGRWLKTDLRGQGVNVDHVREKQGTTPTSYITVNRNSGSRTIVHYRDLAELSMSDFEHIKLELIDWFHFEGRNTEGLKSMLEHTQQRRVDQPISLEMEKQRPGLIDLANLADVLFFSRPYAEQSGFTNPEEFLKEISKTLHRPLISLSWGANGAWGKQPGGSVFHVPAEPVDQIIDSVGAGDTYNAGVINALASGMPFEEAVTSGCRLAELKLHCHGLGELPL